MAARERDHSRPFWPCNAAQGVCPAHPDTVHSDHTAGAPEASTQAARKRNRGNNTGNRGNRGRQEKKPLVTQYTSQLNQYSQPEMKN